MYPHPPKRRAGFEAAACFARVHFHFRLPANILFGLAAPLPLFRGRLGAGWLGGTQFLYIFYIYKLPLFAILYLFEKEGAFFIEGLDA